MADLEGSPTSLTSPYRKSESPEDKGSSEKSAHDVSGRKLNEYLFKAIRYRHMDFELARFIMIKSILSPK